MTPEKCTLMLMRDDGRSWRRRITVRSFCIFCALLALMPPLLAGAFWGVRQLCRSNAQLETRISELEQENAGIHSELTRLANLEQLLEMPGNAELFALQMQLAKNKAAEQTASLQESPPSREAKDQSRNDAASAEGAPAAVSPAVDRGLISVENVHARFVSGDKLRIALDLHNSQQKRQLAGYVACSVKNLRGEIQPLEIPKDVANFRINRFKRAVLAPRLPAAMRTPSLTVIVEIHLEDQGVVYRNEFLVER